MAVARTQSSVAELESKLDTLAGMFEAFLRSQQAPKVEPAASTDDAPLTWNIDGMSHAEVRKLAILHEVPVTARGVTAQSTRDALKAKLGQVDAPKERSTAKVAVVSDGKLDLFAAPMSRGERDEVRISSNDAAEALATHPKRELVLKVTGESWSRIAKMGAFNAYIRTPDGTDENGKPKFRIMGDESKGHKPNPGNLNGADRRVAKFLAGKPGKGAKIWTLYQGCLILDKLDAAGLL